MHDEADRELLEQGRAGDEKAVALPAFGKVGTEAEPGLAAAFQIRAIPTLMVLRDGVLLAVQPGMVPAAAIDELVRKVRALDMDEVRRNLDEQERTAPRVANAGGV